MCEWIKVLLFLFGVGEFSFYLCFKLYISFFLYICTNITQEYEELANKIHEYQLREQRLQEQMSMGGGSPPPSPPHDKVTHDEPLLSPGPPLTPNNSNSNLRSLATGQRSPQLGRSSNAHIKAFLPNSMVTTVSLKYSWIIRYRKS